MSPAPDPAPAPGPGRGHVPVSRPDPGHRHDLGSRPDLGHQHVLTIDLGTGGPKVGLVALDGTVRWSVVHSVATDRPSAGRALQDAEEWWQLIRHSVRDALRDNVVDPASVVAVGITGQWGSVVPVAADGRPVAPCRTWMDTSAAAHSKRVVGGPALGYHPARVVTWIRKTAGVPSPYGGDPVSHLLGFRHDEPEVGARAAWFLEPVDYLAMRFTGRAVASPASLSGWWLIDQRHGGSLDYDAGLLRLLGLDRRVLPPLIPSGGVIGPVLPEVAADLGLPAGVSVVTGLPDVHTAYVGSGAIDDFQAHVTISTTSWISCAVPFKKTDALHSIATIPGLARGSSLLADNHEAAGSSLAWARGLMAPASFEELTALAATSPPGAGGVTFSPWLAGMRSPVDDRTARAGWHGMSLATTRGDLIRALMEGVALQSSWLLRYVDKFTGRRLDGLRILGGGAISDLWCQMHADALGRRIERVAEPMTAQLRGAGLVAGLAIGAIDRTQIPELVPVDRVFTPDPANRELYSRLAAALPKRYAAEKGFFTRR